MRVPDLFFPDLTEDLVSDGEFTSAYPDSILNCDDYVMEGIELRYAPIWCKRTSSTFRQLAPRMADFGADS